MRKVLPSFFFFFTTTFRSCIVFTLKKIIWMDGWIGEYSDGYMDRWGNIWMDEWMGKHSVDAWMMDGWMDGQTFGGMDG